MTSEMNIKAVRKLDRWDHKLVKHRGSHIFKLQCQWPQKILKSKNFAESNIIRGAEVTLVKTK